MYLGDMWLHEQNWVPESIQDIFCLSADMSFGWGPGASDWEERKSWWMPAVYRFFWPGQMSIK